MIALYEAGYNAGEIAQRMKIAMASVQSTLGCYMRGKGCTMEEPKKMEIEKGSEVWCGKEMNTQQLVTLWGMLEREGRVWGKGWTGMCEVGKDTNDALCACGEEKDGAKVDWKSGERRLKNEASMSLARGKLEEAVKERTSKYFRKTRDKIQEQEREKRKKQAEEESPRKTVSERAQSRGDGAKKRKRMKRGEERAERRRE